MIALSQVLRLSTGRMLGFGATAFGLLFAFPVVTVFGAPMPAATGGPDFAAIDRYVQAEMDAQRIPGLALGIVHGGSIVHLRGFGDADPSGRAVTPGTPFFIGSVTKSFTALAIMQLKEAGEVKLDAPVQRYLPWWRVADADASAQVTVRDLLYQVSGFSKATGNMYAASGVSGPSALEDRVRSLRSVQLTESVGTVWQYSNANYWTLGMIVQAVSGQPYETYVEQHIFAPLEMHDSFTSQTEAEADGLVSGYRYWFGFPFAADVPFDGGGVSAGGICSSVTDMARYLSANLNDGRYRGTQLVSAAGMAELHRAAVPTGYAGISYAMGWEVKESNGIPTVSHDGSGFNSHANVVLVPGSRWGVVLLENAENSPDEFFGARRMTAIAFGVTSMVMGKEPLPAGSSAVLWGVYGTVLAILALQIFGIIRSVRTFRKWQTDPQRRPQGGGRTGLVLGIPLAVNLIWAFIILFAVPRKVGVPLSVLLMGLPDLAYPLVGSAIVAIGWGVARTIWAVLILRSPRRLPIIDEPIGQKPVST
jgi:CubicO group peptidase (beta-lactamase class C family)